jgi:hypothetical protein
MSGDDLFAAEEDIIASGEQLAGLGVGKRSEECRRKAFSPAQLDFLIAGDREIDHFRKAALLKPRPMTVAASG